MPYFANYGTKEQKDHYIPKMTSGELVGAIGMTEPDAGSDLQGIRTRAKKDGDDYIWHAIDTYLHVMPFVGTYIDTYRRMKIGSFLKLAPKH